MDIDYKIISFFREFVQDISRFEIAQTKLVEIRNRIFLDKSLKDSRAIWFSLILFKFKKELEVPEHLWSQSRLLVIGILKRAYDIEQTANEYLEIFNNWKKDDYSHLVADMASFYYNLLEIRKSIEMTDHATTRAEWEPHYTDLINRVRQSCSRMGCLEELDTFLITMDQKKYDIVSQVMERAYWDRIEEDLVSGDYMLFFLNLQEIKGSLLEIHPKSIPEKELEEIIDIHYIQELIKYNNMDNKYIIGLYRFILGYLREWDALHFRQKYDQALADILKIENAPLSNLIRQVLQKVSILVLDFKTRKAVWEKILNRGSNSS